MTERVPFKEGLNLEAIHHLADQLHSAWPSFDVASFAREAGEGLDDLELKDRVRHVIQGLEEHLPDDYAEALEVLLRTAGSWRHLEREDGLGSFGVWPLIDFVGAHGLGHFDASMQALRAMTSLWSAEFAIRSFLIEDPERAFQHLDSWTSDPDHHVRRLVSEGTRSRLPWGQRLPGVIADPSPVVRLLEALRDDESEYVRRSVANNLNDLSKDHPELVVEICQAWQSEQGSKTRAKLVRHGLRTLIKAGHPGALRVLGFDPEAQVEVENLSLGADAVRLGESLSFSFGLVCRSEEAEKLVVDYAMHMTKKAGHRAAKVFKLKNLELAPGERVLIEKSHPFKKVTVRSYHSGRYAVEILVNGVSRAQVEFDFEA